MRRICLLALGTLLLQSVHIPVAAAAFREDFRIVAALQDSAVEKTLPPEFLSIDSSKPLDRATFTALVVSARYSAAEIDRCFWDIASSVPPRFTLLFRDVSIHHSLAKHICIALRDGIVHGYGQDTFRPEASINVMEASVIVSRAYSLAPFAEGFRHDPWYLPYVQSLAVRNALPPSIVRLDQFVTKADLTEIQTRLEGDITWRPGRSMEELLPQITAQNARIEHIASARTDVSPFRVKLPPLPSASTEEESLQEPDISTSDAREERGNRKRWWEVF